MGSLPSGLEVTCYSRPLPPYLNSDLITELGAHYVSSQLTTLAEASAKYGPFDLIFEASGFSPLAFQAAEVLVTAPHGGLARGFWNDAGVPPYTIGSFHALERDTLTAIQVSHGTIETRKHFYPQSYTVKPAETLFSCIRAKERTCILAHVYELA